MVPAEKRTSAPCSVKELTDKRLNVKSGMYKTWEMYLLSSANRRMGIETIPLTGITEESPKVT